MKSIMQEGSSPFKAIEAAWTEAGKPSEFTVRILENETTNFLGFVKHPAKVAFYFDLSKEKDRRTSTRSAQKSSAPHRRSRQSNQRPTQRSNGQPQRPSGQRSQDRPIGASRSADRSTHIQRGRGQRPEGREPSQRPTSQRPESQRPESQRPEGQRLESQRPESQREATQRTESRRPQRRDSDDRRPREGFTADITPQWNQDMVALTQNWIKETLNTMNLSHITYTIEPSDLHLRITFRGDLLPDPMKEKRLFAHFASLILETLKRHFKMPLRGHKIVLLHATAYDLQSRR